MEESKVVKFIFRSDRILPLQRFGRNLNEDFIDFFLFECKAKELLDNKHSMVRVRQLTGENAGRVYNVCDQWGDDFFSRNGNIMHIQIGNYAGFFSVEELHRTFIKEIFGERVMLEQLNKLKEDLVSENQNEN